MKAGAVRFRASIASPSDYRLVARLCRRAVGPGDYVLSILREVIRDKELFLAWNGVELVGMTNFDECVDGSGWLSMARTDPDWRGRGVALFLQRQIAAHARRRGIGVLRLWTLSRNIPSIRACKRGGFRPVCEASHISYNLRTARRRKRPPPLSRPTEGSLKSFLKSNYLSKMNGYFAYKWHFVKANRKLLEKLLRGRELYSIGELAFVLTKPEESFHRLHSSFTLLNGPMALSLRTVRQVAKGLGAAVVGSYIPYDPYALLVARRLSFNVDPWGKHCIVFEKQLS